MTHLDGQRRALITAIAAGGCLAVTSPGGSSHAAGMESGKTPTAPLTGYHDNYESAFSSEEYADRLRRLRASMARAKIDILNVSSPQGMCYLHGYQATWYMAQSPMSWLPQATTFVHVDRDELIHFDSDYEKGLIAATSQVKDPVFTRRLESPESLMTEMLDHLKGNGWFRGAKTVGLELYSFVPSPAVSARFQDVIRRRGFKLVDGTPLIRGVQKVKSPQELAYVRLAATICDLGHRAIADSFYDGITQLELWSNALNAMYRAGGEPAGLNQGVLSGPHTSGHDYVSTRRIRKGEAFRVDLCGVVHRYHANLERTYCAGDPEKDLLRAIADSAGAYPVLVNAARPGARVGEVVAELRRYYRSTAMYPKFRYFLGYELGISFPPDWVNEWNFSDEDPDTAEAVFEARTVTNFESMYRDPNGPNRWYVWYASNIDTVIYDNPAPSVLGMTPRTVISVA